MEFFANITPRMVTPERIHQRVTIDRLADLCAAIDEVVCIQSEHAGEIYCVWGQFRISLEKIRNGVRIALLDCPHALVWTVSTKEKEQSVVVHCTIDDQHADQDFVESIEQFVSDWAFGLEKFL